MGAELDVERRERLVDALAGGCSILEAARRSGYGRAHIYRLLDDPRFTAEVEKRTAAKKAEPTSADEELALDVLRTIAEKGEEEHNRVAAAKALLAHVTVGRKTTTKPGPQAGTAPASLKIHEGGDGAKAAADWLEKQA